MPSIKSKILIQEYIVENLWRQLFNLQASLKKEIKTLDELKERQNGSNGN